MSRIVWWGLAVLLGAGPIPASAQPIVDNLRLIAPAAPGGGWDQTARVMQDVLLRAGLAGTVSVENIPGAAGTIGLARFIGAEHGKGDVLMVSGLIMLGAIVTNRSPVTLNDVTPIARLTGEYEAVAVPLASPYMSLPQLIDDFQARPESISWGGGSAGGTDQILAGLIAAAVGVPPERVNYIAFSGGGESMSAILGGQVTVGINGLAEFAPQIQAGALRVLGISSPERLPGLDAPTLREQGVDVELENWRSLVAPPGIRDDDRRRLEQLIGAMARSEPWREALERYRWIDRYLGGEAFARFVDAEEGRVQAILRELGTGRAEASVASAGPYPIFVLGGLALCAAAAAAGTVRRARDARPRAPRAWRPLVLVASGVVLDVALAPMAGFVIASAVLFWFTARAFDTRHPLRDALFGVALSVGAFLLFARVLGLTLPAGPLARWL